MPRTLQALAFLVVVIWGVGAAGPFLVPLCISALLAFLITPLVRRLRAMHLPEWLAIILGSLVMLLPVGALIYLLVMQGQNLVEDFPSIVRSAQDWAAQFATGPVGRKLGLDQQKSLEFSELFGKLSSSAGKGLALVVGGLSAVLSATSQVGLILFFAILMIGSRRHLRGSSEKIIARNSEIYASVLLDEMTAMIQRFLIAKMVVVLIVSLASIIVLKAFGVRYAGLMGIWNGVMLALIPAIGFFIGAVPTLVVALATGHSIVTSAGIVGVLFALNLFEGNFLTPKLVGGRLNIHPIASFIGLFAGGQLWGIWGMFLAIPILGVLRIVFSASPAMQPWGNLLAERDDRELSLSLIRKRPARKQTPEKVA